MIRSKLDLVLVILNRMEHLMSDLAGEQAIEGQAITDLGTRIATITGPLQQALTDAQAARDAAVAADVSDKASLDAANAKLDAALATATTQVASLNSLAQPPAPPAA